MLICKNCHAPLSDDSLFCEKCGAKVEFLNSEINPEIIYCQNCGNPSSTENSFCENCGKPLAPNFEVLSKRHRLKKELLFSAAGIAAVSACILLFFSFSRKEHISADGAFYVKDKELYFSDLSKKTYQLTESLVEADAPPESYYSIFQASLETGGLSQISKNGDIVFFPDHYDGEDDGFSLYYKNMHKPEQKAVGITTDTDSYHLSVRLQRWFL